MDLEQELKVVNHERLVVEGKLKHLGITPAFGIIGMPSKPEHAVSEKLDEIYALEKRYNILKDRIHYLRKEIDRIHMRGLTKEQKDTIRRIKEMKVYKDF